MSSTSSFSWLIMLATGQAKQPILRSKELEGPSDKSKEERSPYVSGLVEAKGPAFRDMTTRMKKVANPE